MGGLCPALHQALQRAGRPGQAWKGREAVKGLWSSPNRRATEEQRSGEGSAWASGGRASHCRLSVGRAAFGEQTSAG